MLTLSCCCTPLPRSLRRHRRTTPLLLDRLYDQRLSRVEDSLKRLKEGRLSRFKHQQESITKVRTVVLCTVHCALCTAHCALCTAHCWSAVSDRIARVCAFIVNGSKAPIGAFFGGAVPLVLILSIFLIQIVLLPLFTPVTRTHLHAGPLETVRDCCCTQNVAGQESCGSARI